MLPRIFLTTMLLMTQSPTRAATAVQRSKVSSNADYLRYIRSRGAVDFASAFVELSDKMEPDTSHVTSCLEDIHLSRPTDSCRLAVQDLTRRPLNSRGRTLLASLLLKADLAWETDRDFYRAFRQGLTASLIDPGTPSLAVESWKKEIRNKFDSFRLLINGFEVENFADWLPREGVYQWALVSNTHEPFLIVGSFEKFASWSLSQPRELTRHCEPEAGIEKYGLLDVEIFIDRNCILKETSLSGTKNRLFEMPERHEWERPKPNWAWVALGVAAAGLIWLHQNYRFEFGSPISD